MLFLTRVKLAVTSPSRQHDCFFTRVTGKTWFLRHEARHKHCQSKILSLTVARLCVIQTKDKKSKKNGLEIKFKFINCIAE